MPTLHQTYIKGGLQSCPQTFVTEITKEAIFSNSNLLSVKSSSSLLNSSAMRYDGTDSNQRQCWPGLKRIHLQSPFKQKYHTWLLFSATLFLFESGKWMWHSVSSITRLMLYPPATWLVNSIKSRNNLSQLSYLFRSRESAPYERHPFWE